MADFHAMHIIEALRSGVPSRVVGEYFSEARAPFLRKIEERMNRVSESGQSEGMIFTGRYGEGKTHLLNTVFNMAHNANMVVSIVPLGKETPMDKLHLLYPKLISGTYLPGAAQPGFRQRLEELTAGSGVAGDLLGYSAKTLDRDKLYFLMSAFLGTQEEEERDAFLSDLEGDFATLSLIKRSYRRVTGQVAKFNQNFRKTKDVMDYFYFMSHLFRKLGYNGWVLLFDEAELLGRLGKKTRGKCYYRIDQFLRPDPRLEGTLSLFAFSSSYAEEVIDNKNEFMNVETAFAEEEEIRKSALNTLNAILNAPELAPLSRAEILQTLEQIQKFHGMAYDWTPSVSAETLYTETEAGGYLLRTRIRGTIEFLDQLYQYGKAGKTKITELGTESYAEEEEVPELEGLEKL